MKKLSNKQGYREFTAKQGDILVATMTSMVDTYKAYKAAKGEFRKFIAEVRLDRSPRCLTFIRDGIASIFGVDAVEVSETGGSLKFSSSPDGVAAKNFYVRDILWALPTGTKGHGRKASQGVVTPAVKAACRQHDVLVALVKALSRDERTAYNAVTKK